MASDDSFMEPDEDDLAVFNLCESITLWRREMHIDAIRHKWAEEYLCTAILKWHRIVWYTVWQRKLRHRRLHMQNVMSTWQGCIYGATSADKCPSAFLRSRVREFKEPAHHRKCVILMYRFSTAMANLLSQWEPRGYDMEMAREHFWIGRMCHTKRRIVLNWKRFRSHPLDSTRRIHAAITGHMTRYAWNFIPFQNAGVSAVLYAEALHQSKTLAIPIDMLTSQYSNGYHQCTPPGMARYARRMLHGGCSHVTLSRR